MEGLELKHLAPYLHYGLKVSDTSQEDCVFDLKEWLFREKQFVKPFFENHLQQILNDDSLKIILHPLSYLKKEIEVNGEKFVPIVELAKIVFPHLKNEKKCGNDFFYGLSFDVPTEDFYDYSYIFNFYYNDLSFYLSQIKNRKSIPRHIGNSYELYEKLFEWHFDVFGLIEKGLAIDINTL